LFKVKLTEDVINERVEIVLNNNPNLEGWVFDTNSKHINKNSLLHFNHVLGYKSTTTLYVLRRSLTFTLYDIRMQYTLHNISVHLKLNSNFLFKDGQLYTGCRKPYIYICPSHGEFTKSWNGLLEDIKTKNNKYSGNGCHGCYLEKSSGLHSPHWNFELTDDDRQINRDTSEHIKWREDVYKRDDYTCQYCLRRGEKLEAHHINSYKRYKNLRFLLNNGATLCVECHRTGINAFHRIYGNKNNTEKQYIEWINRREEEGICAINMIL
jgi:5-methylcytosine-specific restriction endonuclease McrA